MKKLTTTRSAIDALGGNHAVAGMVGTTHQAVSNWRRFKIFPANTYVVLQIALLNKGILVPAKLWAMKTGKRKRKVKNARVDKPGRQAVRAAAR